VKHVNIRFPDELHEAATAAANAEQCPLGAWIRNLVEDALSAPSASISVTGAASEGSTSNPVKVQRRDVSPNLKKGGKK